MDQETKSAIKKAFKCGHLEVQSVEIDGKVNWHKVRDVLKHRTPHKKAFRVTVESGEVVATEDHSLFRVTEDGTLEETLTDEFKVGDSLAVVLDGELTSQPVLLTEELDPLENSYDLSVPGPENFVLSNGIVAHNSYSIGGVSLDIDKSSKYESLYQAMSDQFDKQLERAKQTVKIVKGLQQPRYGIGIRSAFGPHTGSGVLTPRKFIGF
jgi:hypothetical protein